MSINTELPLALYKVNLRLHFSISQLARQGSLEWLNYGSRVIGDGIDQSNAQVEALLKAEDWQKLATLWVESFWRQAERRFGDGQASTQAVVNAQGAFTKGVQETLQAWQKETAEALGSPVSSSIPGAWSDLFKAWEKLIPTATKPKR